MKSLPLVLLIAASALLLSVTGQSYDQPQCCKSEWCDGCACRSEGYKYTAEEGQSLKKQLKDNCMEYMKLGTSEDPPNRTTGKPEMSNNSENNTGKEEMSNLMPANNPINCMLCKIAHCY